MVDPRLPSNPTSMLMQAQERKNLVNKLIMLKGNVDKKEPRQYSHLSTGRVNRRNDEVRKINTENQQMLKKIMTIMNRRPVENGLRGVPLKPGQQSNSDLKDVDPSATLDTSFEGNTDIKLMQSNVDPTIMQNRFSFEIMAGTSPMHKGRSPFQARPPADASQHSALTTDQAHSNDDKVKVYEGDISTQKHNSVNKVDLPDVNRFGQQRPSEETLSQDSKNKEQNKQDQRTPTGSQDSYSKVHSSLMFDKKLPVTDSEKMNFQTQQQHSPESGQQAPHIRLNHEVEIAREASNFDQSNFPQQSLSKPLQHFGTIGKKMYPGQVTLNHVVRKNEVKRINRENRIMLNKLRDVKPAVESSRIQIQHAMKIEQYKRNLSKFRPAGKSVPRPRVKPITTGSTPDQLPEINRQNIGDAKPYMIESGQQSRNLGNRRTSQGNRTYLEAKRDFIVPPSTHHMGMRNQRNFNSNLTAQSSEYQNRNQSTHQETYVENDPLQTNMTQAVSMNHNNADTVLPLSSNFYQQQLANTSIGSQDSVISRGMQQSRRTSYLAKLKKSPLLSAINHQQNIPRSIVNRAVNSRDDQVRVNFRKYGEIPRISAAGIPDHLYQSSGSRHQNTILTQSSVMSSVNNRQRNFTSGREVTGESLKDELNKLYIETPNTPIDVQIQPSQRSSVSKTTTNKNKIGGSSELSSAQNPLNESQMQLNSQHCDDGSTTIVGEKEIAPIEEEKTGISHPIQIQDEQLHQAPGPVSNDPYSDEYTGESQEPKSQNTTIVTAIADSNVESAPVGKLEVRQPPEKTPTSTADFGVSTHQLDTAKVPEAKKHSAMSLIHVNSDDNTQPQMTQTQANRTTQNLATVSSLPLNVNEHAQSMPKRNSQVDEFSIPQETMAEDSDFDEDAQTRHVKVANQIDSNTDSRNRFNSSQPINAPSTAYAGVAVKNLDTGSSANNRNLSSQIEEENISRKEVTASNGQSQPDKSMSNFQSQLEDSGSHFGVQTEKKGTKTSFRGASAAEVLVDAEVDGGSSEAEHTVVQSNSMAAAKLSSITLKQKSGTGIHEKEKAERAITEIQSRMSEGPIFPENERVSTLADGNNFETEKASEGVPSQRIVQSKENIILSEISSIKNIK